LALGVLKKKHLARFAVSLLFGTAGVLFRVAATPQAGALHRSAPPAGGGEVQFRILLGIGDSEPTRWDGSIRIRGGKISKLELWRPGAGDRAEAQTWKLTTHEQPPFHSLDVGRTAHEQPPVMVESGLLVSAQIADAQASLDVGTEQGKFAFRVDQAAFGQRRSFLGGRASVERVPLATQLTNSLEEEDYPAAAQSGDTVYIAYVEFTHGDPSQRWPRQLGARPQSFETLARPSGGDQVRLLEYSKSKKTWAGPYAVSGVRQDIYRTAVAVDGEGRVWVIWAANTRGNYDLFARYRRNGGWSDEIRLTQDPGPDLNPVAVTDSAGAVWIAWQGYRRDNFDILVLHERGGAFGQEERVSTSAANDWDPQIAAGKNGEVAVVWDTYEKGDYDVYLRRMRYSSRIGMDTPLPVAASRKLEARPSVTYDGNGRIFVAYEESFRRWGKSFGSYETTGSGIYQGTSLRVKILEGHNYLTTADPLEEALEAPPEEQPPGRAAAKPSPRRSAPVAQPPEPIDLPDPDLAKNRPRNATPYPPAIQSRGFPRLVSDWQGVVFLAYREAAPLSQSPVGSCWFENLMYFDGREWAGPVFLPHSDNTLDNRPALLPEGPGDILIVGSTDYRFSLTPGGNPGLAVLDAFNNDLFLSEVRTGALVRSPRLIPLNAEAAEPPEEDASAERDQAAALRSYRIHLGGETLQLLRGESHRYTEWSSDGGRDGALVDAYRYMLDAAALDWGVCCDHQNGGREYSWWTIQKLADAFLIPGRFVPMFGYERGADYPEGSRIVIMARRGVRPLPRLMQPSPGSPASQTADTQMLYDYLRRFEGIAVPSTPATDLGTDWQSHDFKLEPAAELYNGNWQNYERPDAPRASTAQDSIGGWRPLGFLSRALEKGYRVAFGASSGHISTHMAYFNLWVTAPTRPGVMEALRKRRVYAATDHILADVSCNGHLMGEEFRATGAPLIHVKLVGTASFNRVHIIKDGKYVYTGDPKSRIVDFGWRDNDAKPGTTSSYYVRGEQVNGQLVWVSPMWISIQ
jgi:hypothetical protein